jgi:hypothetical protein
MIATAASAPTIPPITAAVFVDYFKNLIKNK